jgi:hypothetical protein
VVSSFKAFQLKSTNVFSPRVCGILVQHFIMCSCCGDDRYSCSLLQYLRRLWSCEHSRAVVMIDTAVECCWCASVQCTTCFIKCWRNKVGRKGYPVLAHTEFTHSSFASSFWMYLAETKNYTIPYICHARVTSDNVHVSVAVDRGRSKRISIVFNFGC